MWLDIILRILVGTVTCEALVQLWFYGAPIQWLRNLVRRLTPFLYSKIYETHAVDCRYCISVWMGFLVSAFLFSLRDQTVVFFIAALVMHRLSNFLHLVFSLMRDRQIDLRVDRNKLIK